MQESFWKNIYFCFVDYAKAFDNVDHIKLWKIMKEMGIPDHLTCLLRNLYAGQETTVRTGHGTKHRSQIGKGIRQGCILLPCLFNLYAEFSSVAQSCPTLCDSWIAEHQASLSITNSRSSLRLASIESVMPIHRVSDAIHPSHPLSSPSPPAPNPSQHQRLFQWVNSSREVAKVLELQL